MIARTTRCHMCTQLRDSCTRLSDVGAWRDSLGSARVALSLARIARCVSARHPAIENEGDACDAMRVRRERGSNTKLTVAREK